ncbi:hypothetical protein BGX29_005847, partial [Mortierella sp. GBA35]
LNELNAVKYRCLPDAKLPPRLTTTVGGTDYYLSEIRNIVKSKQDVDNLRNCTADRIDILCLDLGQAFVVGACAFLSSSDQHKVNPESGYNDVAMESSLSLVEGGSITKEPPIKFHNLAVNQKAVYQPMLKHRRWLQKKKDEPISENGSIASIEFDLPPRRGPDA